MHIRPLLADVGAPRRKWPECVIAGVLLCVASPTIRALEPQSGEAQAILDCERRLCIMLQEKDARGDGLSCELSKTWTRSVIKNAEQPALKWGFGDARCSAHITIDRAQIVAALTASGRDYKLSLAPHAATCVVELGGAPRSVRATLAPKLLVRDGRVEKIWVNLGDLDGPAAIKATLWTAAKLADNVGLFQRPMIAAVNRFIYTTCPRKYPLQAGGAARSQ